MAEVYYFGNSKLRPRDDSNERNFMENSTSSIKEYDSKKDLFCKVELFKDPTKLKEFESRYGKVYVKDISCGYTTAYITMANGELYAFGEGTQGQIGNGEVLYRQKELTKVIIETKVRSVFGGMTHSAAIDENGECYVWGSAANGKLALKPDKVKELILTPENVDTLNKERKQLKSDLHDKIHSPRKKDSSHKNYADFASVACGKYHTLFLINGSVFSVGPSDKGVLGASLQGFFREGVPLPIMTLKKEKIEGVSCSTYHCLAWSLSGKLYSWGKVSDGCLGYLTNDNSDIQIEPKIIENLSEYDICYSCCGIRRSMCLTTCGRVFSWGKGDRDMKISQEDYFVPMNLFENKHFKSFDLSFVQIACGHTHCAALTSRGKLYMWGDLSFGCQGRMALESSTRKYSYLPQSVDYFNTNGLKIYKVDCGNCFTVVAAISSAEFYLANKLLKPTSNDHISVALKKKLIRRIDFNKSRLEYLSRNKTLSRNGLIPNSAKSIGLDDNQTMPPLFDDRIEQEYGKEKFEELKSNPKLKSYFKEMFTNRNRPFRGKSHVKSKESNVDPNKTKEANAEAIKPKSKRTCRVRDLGIPVSESFGISRAKCMDSNVPESKLK